MNLRIRLQSVEGSRKDWLLTLALWMAKTRQQSFAVEHNRSIRCEYKIGKPRFWFDKLDLGAFLNKCLMKHGPLLFRRGAEGAIGIRPSLRIHPGINGVTHREVLGAAHQKTGLC